MPQFLSRPDRPPLAYERRDGAGPAIVFFPGYGSDMGGSKALALDAWAEATGHALLRFDYAGCGQSEGVFGAETLASWRDDALDVIDSLSDGPLILIGSSMGGWLMLLAALARPKRVVGMIGIAAAPDFTDWGFSDDQRDTVLADGLIAQPSLYSDEPTITTRDFWRSGQANLVLDGIAFDGPVRLLQGMQDPEVPPSIAFRLGRAIRSDDVQTMLIKDGDHRLSRPGDLDLLIATVARLVGSL